MSMTVKQAVDMAKALRPRTPFPNDIFMTWVNEIEAEIHTEIFLLSVSDFVAHTDDTEQLYADPTHNKIYWLYLLCMIDLANGEMTRYQSDVEVYNGFMGEYKRWYAMEYHPADGKAELQGYYLSAYSLAVKHGFEGSEEEWLNFIQANGQAAQEAAARAEGAAQEAMESAEAAEQSAQRAASFEESVARNAEAAEAAAEDALGAAASAALSATAAGDAAEAAEISAGNAQGSASAAQAAQTAAETAKALAETARAAAELASGNAEAARSAAETARAAAEAARDTSVSSAGAAQASALAAEAAKTASEAARNAAQAAQSAAAASAAAALVSEGKAAISATDAEAWAVGQRNGVDVGPGDPTYQNNAKWYKDQAEEIVGGDFATKTEAQGYANVARDAAISEASADATAKANGALSSAKIYTDTAIAAIPVPDVSGQIATHNASGTAHGDIRGLVTAEATARAAADGALQTAVNGKADKKVPAAAGNIAALDATGGLVDTGKQPGDFGIPDAPADDETYARKNNEWVALPRFRVFGVSIDLANSNPETAVTYTDEAVGMSPGAAWDDMPVFRDIKPCVLKDGIVQYYLNPNNFDQKADGTAADITSGNDGDVMIEIPKIGFVINTVGDTLTIKITDAPDNPDFKYYAHTRDTEGDRDMLYIGAYLGFTLSSRLRSLSGRVPTASQNMATFRTRAQANGAGYDMVSFYPLTLLQCLYLIKFKNLNSQVALGRGFVDNNPAAIATGGTNAKGMNFGETTGKLQMRFLGIEDFWGNLRWWIEGFWAGENINIWTAFQNFNNDASGYINRGQGAGNLLSGYVSKPQGTSETGFIVKEVNGSATTYFSDNVILGATEMPFFGGNWRAADVTGAFYLYVNNAPSYAHASLGARLMYL